MIGKAGVLNLCFFCYLYKLYENRHTIFIINQQKEMDCL